MVDELLAARTALRPCAISTASLSAQGPGRSPGCGSRAASCRGSRSARTCRWSGVGTLLAMAEGSAAPSASCAASMRAMGRSTTRPTQRSARRWRHACTSRPVAPGGRARRLPGDALARAAAAASAAYREALEQRYAGRLSAIDAGRVSACARHRAACRAGVRGGPRRCPPKHAAPVYMRDKVALRIDERMSAQLDSLPRYRRMTARDLDAVVAIERGDPSASVDARQLQRFARRRATTAGSSNARGGDRRLRRGDDRGGRSAPAQPERGRRWQRQGIGRELLAFVREARARLSARQDPVSKCGRRTRRRARSMRAPASPRSACAATTIRRATAREDAVVMELELSA